MEIVAWLGWAVAAVLGVLWSLVWFLISGWVSTLLQIAVLIATIYFLKYGWQRAPVEILRRTALSGASSGAGCEHENLKQTPTFTCVRPKPVTSGMEAKGKFGKHDFVYLPDDDVYRCPAGEWLTYHFTTVDGDRTIRRYSTTACGRCELKARCTTAKNRVISRWEHEHVMEAVQKRLDANPQAMRARRETVEHPFGTLKMTRSSAPGSSTLVETAPTNRYGSTRSSFAACALPQWEAAAGRAQ